MNMNKIKSIDYEHLKDKSVYNYNYFRHKETGVVIIEKCDEYYDSYDYYTEDGEYIGTSDNININIEEATEFELYIRMS